MQVQNIASNILSSKIKSTKSKLYFAINERISFNVFYLTENYPSKALFEDLEPSFDDEVAKIWEDNTWRIEYFFFLKEKIMNKKELN